MDFPCSFNLILFIMKFNLRINTLFLDISWSVFKMIIEFTDKIMVMMTHPAPPDWCICTFSPKVRSRRAAQTQFGYICTLWNLLNQYWMTLSPFMRVFLYSAWSPWAWCFTKWGITNIFKNENIPLIFFWCDFFFMSELCLIKRRGRPRNIENQPAILSPQSYVFTLLWEKRDLTKFDCPNINLQNWRQITKMFILLLSIQNTESVLSDAKFCIIFLPVSSTFLCYSWS